MTDKQIANMTNEEILAKVKDMTYKDIAGMANKELGKSMAEFKKSFAEIEEDKIEIDTKSGKQKPELEIKIEKKIEELDAEEKEYYKHNKKQKENTKTVRLSNENILALDKFKNYLGKECKNRDNALSYIITEYYKMKEH